MSFPEYGSLFGASYVVTGVPKGMIGALQLVLSPQLHPRYYIAIEERVYVTEPDQCALVGVQTSPS